MTYTPSKRAASSARDPAAAPLVYEYHLTASQDLSHEALGSVMAGEMRAAQASDALARERWQRALLALRRALGGTTQG